MSIIWFLVLFTFVVIVHEGGHTLFAKMAGVRVYQFSIGFGPKIYSRDIGDINFTVGIVPLGGFVRLAGIDDSEEQKPRKGESYNDKSILQRVFIITGGALFNLLSAVVIFALYLMIFGVGEGVSNRIETIVPGSPAYELGLKAGDEILYFQNNKVTDVAKMVQTIHQSKGRELKFIISRDNAQISLSVEPIYDKKTDKSYVGFNLAPEKIKRYDPFRALYYGLLETLLMIKMIVVGIGAMLFGKVSISQIAGPLGIMKITGDVASYGFAPFIRFIAFFSINLGVINLLPFPALDGGRLIFLLLEGLFGKRAVSQDLENKVHIIGFAILIALLLWVSYYDVLRVLKDGFQ